MPNKKCDHTSVGILVWRSNKLLLIERKKPPFGFAPPAGHVDGDLNFKIAAKRELKEEVGLEIKNLQLLIEGKKDNPCRRLNGNWHNWKIYKALTKGKIKRNLKEAKRIVWYTKKQLRELSQITEKYLSGNFSQRKWKNSPGLEPVWYDWLKELNII